MPSDALMELSTYSVTGEAGDAEYGQRTDYGMFEIANFDFEVGEAPPDDNDAKAKLGKDKDGNPKIIQPKTKTTARGSKDPKDPHKGKFKIKKSLDSGSPALLRYCCDKKVIAWAVILVREAGDETKTPYLHLEFRRLQVDSFSWDLDPAESGEGASKMETVGFVFDTILITYSQQKSTGLHEPMKSIGWNFADQNDEVDPLS